MNAGLSVVNGAIEGKSTKEILMNAAMNGVGYVELRHNLILLSHRFIFFNVSWCDVVRWVVLQEKLAVAF